MLVAVWQSYGMHLLLYCRTTRVYDSASAQVICRSLAASNLQLNITTIPPSIPPYEPYV
jgi:hypothetical protein